MIVGGLEFRLSTEGKARHSIASLGSQHAQAPLHRRVAHHRSHPAVALAFDAVESLSPLARIAFALTERN